VTIEEDAWNIELIGHTNLGGFGDCMAVRLVDDRFAYVGHMGTDGTGTSVVDIRDLEDPRVVKRIDAPPGTRSHKVALAGEIMIVNNERNPWGGPDGGRAESWTPGIRLFDISNPASPEEVGFFPTPGLGTHRMTVIEGEPLVMISRTDDGYSEYFFAIIDISDPSQPREVSRWWLPGMHIAGGEKPHWPEHRVWKHHHSLVRGPRAYAGWWDGGLVILDISDIRNPSLVSHLEFGEGVSARTHTALPLPGRDLLVVTDEGDAKCHEVQKLARMVDITDERSPLVIATFPVPKGDFCDRPGWAGPHNVHEMRSGTFQSSDIVHMTYFNAGLRVFDVTDAHSPQEIAYYLPAIPEGSEAIQMNDLTVSSDGTIFVTDRTGGGLYILRMTV